MKYAPNKMSDTRIVLMLDGMKQGGIQQAYLLLISEYCKVFAKVLLIVLESTKQDLEIPYNSKLEVFRLNSQSFFDIKSILHARSKLRKFNPSFIVVSIYRSQIWSVICAPRSTNIIWIENNTYFNRSQLQWQIMKLAVKRVKKIVSISYEVKKITDSKLGIDSEVVPCPVYMAVTTNRFNLRNEDFVFIGRMVDQKNPELMLRSFALFTSKYRTKSKLHMLGDGNLLEEMKKLAFELRVDRKIIFHGNLENDKKNEILSKSRSLISTSKFEGLGIVKFEALANGCCLITTKTGGTSLITNSPEDGIFLVESSEIEIAERMKETLNLSFWSDKRILRRMNTVKKFNPFIIANELINI